MNEIFEQDIPVDQNTDMAGDLLQQIGRDANLATDEYTWLEQVFGRIGEGIADILNINDGYDTERIMPRDNGGDVVSPVVDYNIERATQEWHWQESDYSCGVCSQQFIINEFLGLNVTEAELAEIAYTNGWYDPEGGTPFPWCGNLLEYYGIDTQINYSGTVQDLKTVLDQGGRVIAGVDSNVLWTEGVGTTAMSGPDHVLEVIGLDTSDPNNVKVIINDSGIPDGCGKEVPLAEFMEAWEGSGCFMISAMPNN